MSATTAHAAPVRRASGRLQGIDSVRLLSIFAVVLAHVLSEDELNHVITFESVISQLTHFSVAFSFTAGGYLLGRRKTSSVPSAFSRVAWRVGPAFLTWLLVYNVLVPHGIPDHISLRYIVVLFGTGGSGYHLWFLPTYLMSTAIVLLLTTYLRWSGAFAVAMLLYLAGLAIGSYAGLFSPSGQATVLGLTIARGGPFFGPICVLYGFWFAQTNRATSLRVSLALLLGGAALQLTEAYILNANHLIHFVSNDFLLGTIAFGIGAFSLSLHLPSSSLPVQFVARFGRLSFGIYSVHLLFVLAFRAVLTPDTFVKKLGIALLALIVSIIVTLLLEQVRRFRPVAA